MISEVNNTKGVLSSIYRSLLSKHINKVLLPVKDKWVSDIRQISEDQWDNVHGLTLTLSLCEAKRFSKIKLIHRAYKSLSMLFTIGARADLNCPRCGKDDAHVIRIM